MSERDQSERLAAAPSRAIELARELALLGAESLLAAPVDRVLDVHQGFENADARWLSLGDRLRDFESCPAKLLRPLDQALRERLLEQLGLSSAGMWLVSLAAAAELHPEAAGALSLLAEDERVQLPTPTSAARLLTAALRRPFIELLPEFLIEGGPRQLGLVEALEVVPGRPLAQQGLRLRERELVALLGGGALASEAAIVDEREAPTSEPIYPLPLVAGVARLLSERGLVCLRCASARAGRQLALDLASVDEREAMFVTVDEQLPSVAELARMRSVVRVLDLSRWLDPRPLPVARLSELAATIGELLVIVNERSGTGKLAAIDVPALGLRESQRVWSTLGCDDIASRSLGQRFRVGVEQARAADREARDRLALGASEREPTLDELATALRNQGARRMGRMVTHLRSPARLDQLVVPPAIAEQLADIVGWYRASARVERELGSREAALGRGLSCLFSGQPGTGKTFAAQCLANELGLNLYRIDLSQVVSKWLGETEKALAQVFDEAEAGHGVLLFDEADALFGKRTEVKDAHDRYANVEVGYLLQRMESFAGIAILTTNLRSNIDAAFLRRLRFVIEFPMPDTDRRASLWEQALPRQRDPELDLEPFVRRFRLSGGHIHNIALAAAHLAAAADRPIATADLVRATFRELEKAGLARSASDFGPLAQWLGEAGRPRREVGS